VQIRSSTAYATDLMRKVDPNFDLFELEKEVDMIFKQFYEAFLRDETELLEKVSASTALGMMSAIIKARKEMVIKK
jgi:import inner membrane translocase subunit TIM44